MMSETWLLACAGVLSLGLAVLLGGWAVAADAHSLPYRYWALYVGYLETRLRALFLLDVSGRHIAGAQCAVLAVVLGAAVSLGHREILLAAPLVAALPALALERWRFARGRAVEATIDAFITTLANALKTTPSIGSALAYTQPMLPPPLHEELGLALKEMRVGSSLDEALINMGARVRSLPLDAALSSVLIGRQVGGDLPAILETTAATLREMARLKGVLRTKTAEGKGQLIVLAVFPALILASFDTLSPGYFAPLTRSAIGYAVVAIAVCLWIGAVALARKILAVDL